MSSLFSRFKPRSGQVSSKDKDTTPQEIGQYWHQLRATKQVPLNSDLRAVAIKTFLANIFIADKFAQGLIQKRTADEGIKTLVGDDP